MVENSLEIVHWISKKFINLNFYDMKKSYTLLVLTMVLLPFITLAQTWLEVGKGGFSKGESYHQGIILEDTIPYVAYVDMSNDAKGTVMKFSDGSWTPVGSAGFTESAHGLDFAAYNKVLYVAYANDDGKLSVMSNDGGDWSYVGEQNFASVGSFSLSVDNGTVYVAFEDDNHENRVSVEKFGNGWEYVGEPGFSTVTLPGSMDMFAHNGNIYVVYRDDDHDYKATVMKYGNEGVWSVLGNPGFTGGTYDSYNGITVKDGQPYVVGWNSSAQATVYTFAGSSWEIVGSEGISSGQGWYNSIYTSPDGSLYLAYSDGGMEKKIFLKKYNNGVWEPVGDAISKLSGENISIAVDESGKPYVAYRDDWYMRRTTVMVYGKPNGIINPSNTMNVSIYPNPSSGKFFVDLENEGQAFKVEVMNPVGQLVLSSIISSNQIDLSGLNSGVYFLRISTEKKSVVQRVAIQK